MDKSGSRLFFVERKESRVTEEVLIANYTMEQLKIPVPMVSNDEDTNEAMPLLESQDANEDISDSEEEEEEITLPSIAQKKTRFSDDVVIDVGVNKKQSGKENVTFKDALLSEPKLPTMS